MNPLKPSRRQLLKSLSSGFGYLAFAGLAAQQSSANAESVLATKRPHFRPRARNVIFLFMSGGPSHVDTFDHKPELTAATGKTSASPGRNFGARLMGSPWSFRQHGESGLWVSELFPRVAEQADELCILKGMQTNLPAHSEATLMLHTGSSQFIRPSLGAWTLYGLGSESDNLPGFVAIKPNTFSGGSQNYGSAFLPSACQATPIGQGRQPVAQARIGNIRNPRLSEALQRRQLDLIQSMNRGLLDREGHHPGVDGVIESYELAFRMQDSLPTVLDIAGETPSTRILYGLDESATADFGHQCLLARRMVESGVRFVELTHSNWDQHRDLRTGHEENARAVDQPIAGLLTDLRARGLLEETLVIWGGEFGRTPHGQNEDGRDHNSKGFCVWMAGGGIRPGFAYGATDELGYEAVENPVHIHDLHATILHLLGLNHERLTYRYAGRDMRLTDIHGVVQDAIIS